MEGAGEIGEGDDDGDGVNCKVAKEVEGYANGKSAVAPRWKECVCHVH